LDAIAHGAAVIRVLSFGAGRQTVALARMSLDGELPPLDHMIFADTGAELPGTYAASDADYQRLPLRPTDGPPLQRRPAPSTAQLFRNFLVSRWTSQSNTTVAPSATHLALDPGRPNIVYKLRDNVRFHDGNIRVPKHKFAGIP
jgi:hypothetical protein